jgi:hypothetical protein
MKSVDPATGKRVDAAEAYFVPAASRQNLKVVTGAHVIFSRCLFNLSLLYTDVLAGDKN